MRDGRKFLATVIVVMNWIIFVYTTLSFVAQSGFVLGCLAVTNNSVSNPDIKDDYTAIQRISAGFKTVHWNAFGLLLESEFPFQAVSNSMLTVAMIQSDCTLLVIWYVFNLFRFFIGSYFFFTETYDQKIPTEDSYFQLARLTWLGISVFIVQNYWLRLVARKMADYILRAARSRQRS